MTSSGIGTVNLPKFSCTCVSINRAKSSPMSLICAMSRRKGGSAIAYDTVGLSPRINFYLPTDYSSPRSHIHLVYCGPPLHLSLHRLSLAPAPPPLHRLYFDYILHTLSSAGRSADLASAALRTVVTPVSRPSQIRCDRRPRRLLFRVFAYGFDRGSSCQKERGKTFFAKKSKRSSARAGL